MRWFKENRFKILFNLFAIFLIFLCSEYVIYLFFESYNKPPQKVYPFFMLASYLNKDYPEMSEYFELLNSNFYKNRYSASIVKYRNPVGLNYKNKPILLFGCSFAFGYNLNKKQTFYYKLSQLTKRPVYNKSMIKWGIQHMLYHLKQEDFYLTVPKPEYVIYLYIPDHISRMYKTNFMFDYNYLKYKERFGKLYEEKRLQNIPYSRLLNCCVFPLIANIKVKDTKRSFNLFKLHLLECRDEIDKHWGKDVNLIIFDYETRYNYTGKDIFDYQQYIQKLKEDRIYVIKTSELTDVNLDDVKYYISKDDHHPNEKAWNLLTPLLVKKVKEIGL